MVIEKPIAVLYCTADFRKDRCPAMIQDNEHVTATSACLRCEHSKIRHFKRGQAVAETGKKGTDEKKEYTTSDETDRTTEEKELYDKGGVIID